MSFVEIILELIRSTRPTEVWSPHELTKSAKSTAILLKQLLSGETNTCISNENQIARRPIVYASKSPHMAHWSGKPVPFAMLLKI